MPILLLPPMLLLAYVAFVVGLYMLVWQQLSAVLSPVSLLQSAPATGFSAFRPQRYMPAVLQAAGNISWTGFMPSLPDWDQ